MSSSCRHTATLALLSSLFILPMVGLATAFSDTDGHRFDDAISILKERRVAKGYSDGSFKPDALINRAEFLVLTIRYRDLLDGTSTGDSHDVRCFTDVSTESAWYVPAVCRAKELKIVVGYGDGTFGPERPVTTVEALKMAIVALRIPLPEYTRAPTTWYGPYIDAAAAHGVLTLLPANLDHQISRGEMAAILVGLRKR